MEKTDYSIQFVSNITGINPHTIRAWEKRYSAVVPKRNESGRRVYNKEEVERLQMLHDLVDVGNNISDIANLPSPQLLSLHKQYIDGGLSKKKKKEASEIDFNRVLQNLILALDNYKLDIINHEFEKLADNLDPRAFALDLIAPLLHEVGIQVQSRRISVGQEHSLSAIIRFHVGKFLYSNTKSEAVKKKAPFILTTPEGELHEFGIMIGALLCVHYELNYVYLGTNMPSDALADTAKQIEAGTVLIGVSPFMNHEKPEFTKKFIMNLSSRLPEGAKLWVGGGNLDSSIYPEPLIKIIPSLQNLDMELSKMSSSK
ncbi:MAG: DNA-binding transcriptional MerR regulator [Bacteriovoracaceae bacterium]|jgi:DNA-binding transcriptional MerR regulator